MRVCVWATTTTVCAGWPFIDVSFDTVCHPYVTIAGPKFCDD